jgi:tRNA A-37 threonylcarbamoyl transferase component Bud32
MITPTTESSIAKRLVGSAIGNYEVTGLLGRGGMATVYRARQESMGRDVAIKIVPNSDDESRMALQRFEQEVQLIAQLQHPRILPVYDFGQTDDFTYLVMRLVETGTLADRLEKGPMDIDETIRVLDQLAGALDYAHQHGVVHRDLKPANVFLDEAGNVYLADFGLAKLLERVDTQLTATGYVLGTPAYMSPEQITDQPIDKRVDVYALGLILFEMLTGRQVFSGSTPASVIFKHVSDPPPLPSSLADHLTPEIDAVVLQALEKAPDDRQQTAGELAADFKAAIYSGSRSTFSMETFSEIVPGPPAPESMVQPGPLPAPGATSANRRWLIGGGLAVLAIGGLAMILVLAFAGVYLARNLLPDAAAVEPTQPAQLAASMSPTETALPTATEAAEESVSLPTSTPLAATPTSVAPTPTMTVTAMPEAATPTAPATATPIPTLEPTPTVAPVEPGEQRVGRVRFLSAQSRLDTVNIELTGVDTPPTGKHYEGWLVSDSGSTISIGTFAPDGNGNVEYGYADPEGRNLAAIYSGFRASLEPDFGDTPEISPEIVLEGTVDRAVVPLVREAVQRSSEVPLRSLIEGLETEVALGADHLGFAHSGLAGGNLAGGLNHIEHAINILVGANDERFGDKNGDGQPQNPGDGFGVLGYLGSLQTKAAAAAQADPTSAELALHAEFLQALIQNATQRTGGIVQLLERCFAQDSAESALTLLEQALTLYGELQTGLDTNGNQVVEPIQGEGGITLLAQHTGYLANIEIYRVAAP